MSHFGETVIDQHEVPQPFWSGSDLPFEENPLDRIESPRCAICGLYTAEYEPFGDWRRDIVVLGDLTREYEYVQTNRKYHPSCEDPAVFSARLEDVCNVSKGCCLTLQGTSRFHFAYAADTDKFNGGPNGKNTVYIPLHRSCFLIALKAPVWEQAASSPLRAMFRVLRHRYQAAWELKLKCFPPPHDRGFLNGSPRKNTTITTLGFQRTEGIDRGYFSHHFIREAVVPVGHYLSYDPLNIPGLTATLLINLEVRPCYRRTQEMSKFRKRFLRLPDELKLLVFEYMTEAQDWPLTCTRLLGPLFWKSLFNKNNPCFSWLWDLDEAMIRRNDPHLIMDWELLFRKISQEPKVADCFGGNSQYNFETYRGVLKHMSDGLEGRRRIWKLLSEMYIGDRNSFEELWQGGAYFGYSDFYCPGAEVPVYWGGNGEQLGYEELRAL